MQTTMTSNMKLGGIQLPVTQRNFLINPAEPFKNLWLYYYYYYYYHYYYYYYCLYYYSY